MNNPRISFPMLFVALSACSGENDGVRTYTPDWDGVTSFLQDSCVVCHREGGNSSLVFPGAIAEDLWTGSEAFVVPGDPAASKLWRVISGTPGPGDYGIMPLGTEPLPEQTVAHVREWILAGAALPPAPDGDLDGFSVSDGDCDDTNPDVFPGNSEICNGIDDNCDGITDEGLLVTGFFDEDGNGFGSGLSGEYCAENVASVSGDCDDTDPAVMPGVAERCDGIDNNCDGLVDDPSASDAGQFWADLDADGFGDATLGQTACEAPAGYVENADDCDDTRSETHPAANERCDGLNNDCDARVDEQAVDASTWYQDRDRDGFGTDSVSQVACEAPNGFVAESGDCNDLDHRFYPGASETVCGDPNDYNCDGYSGSADTDGDGFAACEECNDGSAATFPGAGETCDSMDNDCDGAVDEDAIDATAYFVDSDGDSYGGSATVLACELTTGITLAPGDCNDSDPLTRPGATEVCNGEDSDCDGTIDEDGVGGHHLV